LFSFNPNEAKTHHGGTGVDAKYNTFADRFGASQLLFFSLSPVNDIKGTYMKRILKWMNAILGIVFFIWLAYRLTQEQDGLLKLQHLLKRFSSDAVFWFILATLIVPLNLSIDAYKWRLALQTRFRLSQSIAIRAVLVGLSVGILTPNRLGEFAGRLFFVTPRYRLAAITATLISSISALIVVYFFGGLALFWFNWPSVFPIWLNKSGSVLVILALGLLVSIYFGSNHLLQLIRSIPRGKRFTKFLRLSAHFSTETLIRLLLISIWRSLLTYLQLYLLARFVGLNLVLSDVALFFPLLFLFQAILPSSVFTDLGVRGGIGYLLFFPISGSILLSIMPSYLLWLLNIILPASIGALILLKSKGNVLLGVE
jgi:hypothetical protein